MTVLGYGLLTTDAETLIGALNSQNFRVVIVDESHYMKSRTAARSQILLPLVQKARRAILLTGTPALGRPEEVLESLCFECNRKTDSVFCLASFSFKLDVSNAKIGDWDSSGHC